MPLRFTHPRTRHLSVTTSRSGAVRTILAEGHIDLATEGPWLEQLTTAATSPDPITQLIVDLTGVTHLSWASTAALVRAHHACTIRGRTFTVLAGGPILSGLRLTRLDQTFTITPAPQRTRTVHNHNCSEWLIA